MKSKILSTLYDYLVISLGTLLFTMSWSCFLIPNGITSGGLTGACTILQFATGGLIPLSISYIVSNAILLLLAFLIIGRIVGIRTIYCIALSTVLFRFLPDLDWLQATEGHFFYVEERILIPIIGGLLEAVGVGMILTHDSSTGGTDILALIVNKFWPVSMGRVYLVVDLFIIASILLIPGKTFTDMIYGYIMMITFSVMVDFVLLGRKSTVQLLVFSEKYEAIADYIIHVLNRGVTALKAEGWYTRTDKKVLLILVRKSQLHDITHAIKEIDSKAFVSVSPASSVYGEGFDEMKTGLKLKKKNVDKD